MSVSLDAFEDVYFRILISKYDKDHDGILSDEEIADIKSLYLYDSTGTVIYSEDYSWTKDENGEWVYDPVPGYTQMYDKKIKSFAGIEYLTELERLAIDCTEPDSIDLSRNLKLQEFQIGAGEGNSANPRVKPLLFDISNHPKLKTVRIYTYYEFFDNPIDLEGCQSLESATFAGRIYSINLSNCRNLKELSILLHDGSSTVSSINCSGCVLLRDLSIKRSDSISSVIIESLNINNCISLQNFIVSQDDNRLKFSGIDFGGCTAIKKIDFGWGCNLAKLDVSDCENLEYLDCVPRGNNRLIEEITFDSHPKLSTLICSHNSIKSIDITGMPNIRELLINEKAVSKERVGTPCYVYNNGRYLFEVDKTVNIECSMTGGIDGIAVTPDDIMTYSGALAVFSAVDPINAKNIKYKWERRLNKDSDWQAIGTNDISGENGANLIVPARRNRDFSQYRYTITCNLGKFQSGAATLTVYDGDERGIAINDVNFPDAGFREYLREKYDRDHNGFLRETERNIKSFVCKDYDRDIYNYELLQYDPSKIQSFEGLRYFPNISFIEIWSTNITSLDLKYNTEVENLWLIGNEQLEELHNLEKCTKLRQLMVHGSTITSVDLSLLDILRGLSESTEPIFHEGYTQKNGTKNIYIPDYYEYTSPDYKEDAGLLIAHDATMSIGRPVFTIHPEPIILREGESAKFYAKAIGGEIMLQWQKSYDGETWEDINGASGEELTVEANLSLDGVLFRCSATGMIGTTYSDSALMRVIDGSVQGIVINRTNFPDKNFRDVVLEFDADDNMAISDEEIAEIKYIGCYNRGIKSIEGIQYFTALENLNCGGNELEEIDISNNTNLKVLNIQNNRIADLDVSMLHDLTTLDVQGNQLRTLDCSGDESLETLLANNNQLTFLNIIGCTKLMELEVYGNELQILNVSSSEILVNTVETANRFETDRNSIRYSEEIFSVPCIEFDNGLRIVTDPPPVINSQPMSAYVREGGQAAFFVGAVGGTIKYQWQSRRTSGWINIPEETSPILLLSAQTDIDGTVYRCYISNSDGALYTDEATLTVIPIIRILEQPQKLSVLEGDEAAFSISASGWGISYRWQTRKDTTFQWEDVTSAGQGTDSIRFTAPEIGEYQYRCAISDEWYTVYSDVAVLSVVTTPEITKDPVDAVVGDGNEAAFSVEVYGFGIEYQWQRYDTQNGAWEDLTGETANEAEFRFIATFDDDRARYRCRARNIKATVFSGEATAFVFESVKIELEPENVIAKEGEEASFTIEASGDQASYQWKMRHSEDEEWADCTYNGAQTNRLQFTADIDTDGIELKCLVSNSVSEAYTESVKLTVIYRPTISLQPESTPVHEGSDISLAVDANGGILSYQWQLLNTETGEWEDVSGERAQRSSLDFVQAVPEDSGTYRCMISNVAGDVYSNEATLDVIEMVRITTQPQDVQVIEDNDAVITIGVTGRDVRYQWQEKTTTDGLWKNTSYNGTYNASITVPSSKALDGAQYRCIVSNDVNTEYSDAITLSVVYQPVFTKEPVSADVLEGQSVRFEAAADGGCIEYQWQILEKDTDVWRDALCDGADKQAFEFRAANTLGGTSFRCRAKNLAGEAYTEPASLSVTVLPFYLAGGSDDYQKTVLPGEYTFGLNDNGACEYDLGFIDSEDRFEWIARNVKGKYTFRTSKKGSLEILLHYTGEQSVRIKPMLEAGSVAHIWSSPTFQYEHDIANDFNYDWFEIGNQYGQKENVVTASMPCTMTIRYRPIWKGTL